MNPEGENPGSKKPEDLFEDLSRHVESSLAEASPPPMGAVPPSVQANVETQFAQNSQKIQEKKKKFILVKLEKNTFAIALSSVREVMGLTQLSFLPNMPPYFAGLINLRGKIISAIDLR